MSNSIFLHFYEQSHCNLISILHALKNPYAASLLPKGNRGQADTIGQGGLEEFLRVSGLVGNKNLFFKCKGYGYFFWVMVYWMVVLCMCYQLQFISCVLVLVNCSLCYFSPPVSDFNHYRATGCLILICLTCASFSFLVNLSLCATRFIYQFTFMLMFNACCVSQCDFPQRFDWICLVFGSQDFL